MHILILTQYYPPEVGAPQNRLSDLAERLTSFGHSVTVLTALPNYPTGVIFPDYLGKKYLEENRNGVKVIRTWLYTTRQKSFLKRLLNYFSFTLSSLLIGLWNTGQQDALIVESPPLFLGITGYFLSRIKHSIFVFNVSDLWPESAVAIGVLKNKYLIRLSTLTEFFIYKHADLITGQTQGIVQRIKSRFPEKRTELITNGIDTVKFDRVSNTKRKHVREELGTTNKFVVGYAGLHGLAQGLDTVVKTAQLLADYPEICFVLFGDGPEKENLRHLSESSHLTNLRFFSTYASARMPEILASFDVALIPLRRLDLFKGALPSKMFEAMAAGVPVVVSIEGEARSLVEKAQAGICIPPEDPCAMARAVLKLQAEQTFRQQLGENGRQYVLKHHDRFHIAKQFDKLLAQSRQVIV
jgi:glycosyltransferase involved in cell wall biosynthesis